MKIVKLTLVGFVRMALNSVATFTFTPTEPIQMILGTNGSGKSALLLELTPLPADSSAYLSTGSKTIEITHRGSHYILKSDFAAKNIHSFVKDGEELNKGGTATVQRDLVRKEFNITPEVHNLLVGLEKFHQMNPTERRVWFTRLSDVSYDYAMVVYKRLAEKSRDFSGALKMAKKRLVVESAKVVSDDEEQRLRKDVETTHRELNVLMQETAPLERPVHEIRQQREHGFEELARMSRRLLNMRFAAPYGSTAYGADPGKSLQRDEWGELVQPAFTTTEQLDGFIDTIRHEITSNETLLNQRVQEHDKIKETLAVLAKTGEAGLQELLERKETLSAQRLRELEKCELGIAGLDAINASSALASVYEVLTAAFSSIPGNEDRRFSQTRLSELNQQILTVKDKRLKQANELARMNAEKAHAESHKNNAELECPNCHHRWVAGYSEAKFNHLLSFIADQEETLKKTDAEIAELEEQVQAIRDYGTIYGDFVRCVRSWPVLQPFWDFLIQEEVVTRAPRKALVYLEQFKQDLRHEVSAKAIEDQINELAELIKSTEQIGNVTFTETQQKLHECELQVEDYTHKLRELRSRLQDYTTYRRQLQEAIELGARIQSLTEAQFAIDDELVEAIRRETLAHCVRQLQHSLAIKQETLSEALQQRARVADLEQQVAEYTLKEEAARHAVRELSPHEGLIAQGLFGFIRNYTAQMNSLIRKIWSYPLQVLDCGLSNSAGAELDYKFPLMVKTKSNVVPDVKFGSEAMREIVNAAFRIVAMRHLGLAESPLYLDEFGAAFDKTHRVAATALVKNLMETQPFTQLFMISHYESSYGAFTNAQFCVLDPNNVTVPTESRYNKHVEMT